jgi:hypothetical protein
VTIKKVCIGERNYWPLTPLGTIRNYSAIANLHILQNTTAPAKRFPACCFFTSRSLATASNSGDSSASFVQVLSSQPSAQNFCQLSTQLFSVSLAELSWTANPQLTGLPQYTNSSTRNTSKMLFFSCCVGVRFRGNVLTEPLLRNGRLFIRLLQPLYSLFLLRSLPNNGSIRNNVDKQI